MAVKRRGGAFALVVLALVMGAGAVACKSPAGTPPCPPRQQDLDAAVYQECTSVCIRPGDCAQAFNDDGICPPGFLCALRFTCNPD
ncbi:MAG: hypothetical protein JWM53_6981 [bacterium]|nr:hypothetical protein [bacterium]